MRLKDKVALITGASSGFGEAGARLFAKEGASVMVADINDKAGEAVARSINEAGGKAAFVHVDTGNVAEVEKMIETTVKTFGKLNIFWHNAGIAGPGPLENVTEADFDRLISIHVKGGFFGAKAAIPHLKAAGGGSVLFTSAVAGFWALPDNPVYSMAKASLAILTRCLAQQFGKDNIRVNCVAPGAIKTELFLGLFNRDSDKTTEEMDKQVLAPYPMARYGVPEDVAQGALFLVSDEANYITGIALPIDGGRLAPGHG